MDHPDLNDRDDFISLCQPCAACGLRDGMYAEWVIDWTSKTPVVRIGCLAHDNPWDKDEYRTSGYKQPGDAIREWNAMRPSDA